jgi:LysM repeat protein
MDSKDTPDSQIRTTAFDPNQKKGREAGGGTKKIEPSHLRKNEFAVILFGALLLTFIIFFFFFRSSGSQTESVNTNTSTQSFAELEKRIELLENILEILDSQGAAGDGMDVSSIGPVKKRVASLETAFSVKFDSLVKRMAAIEKNISELKKTSVAAQKSKLVAKQATPVKQKKKTGLFHTIKKGETLYSISKKYNTTVTKIRQLNKLSANANIYPGDSILVR